MRRVIGWFVSNPVAANLLMTILIAGGVISIFQIRQEEMPPIDLDMVSVNVPYLGAAPEEVENGVNLRIEEALEGVQGIYRMTSTSSEGGGAVLLELETNANRIQTANEIKSQIDAISTFPVETERPVVSLMTMINDGLEIAISGDADERTLKELALEARDEIAALEGVSSVEVAYVRPDEISIEVSERTLRRMGLTFDQVANAVRRTSLDMPGGSIRSGAGEILLRTQGQAYTGEDFRDIVVVSREDGTRVYLDEIATIIDGFQEGETQARFDGKPAAIVRVNQVGDEDVVEISETVRAYVEETRGRMPDGIEMTIWQDESESLQARIDILLGSAATGLALVLLLLTLPLEFRLAMWVAAGIPIAMLGTIGVFGAAGITISTLSVVAFILVLGIVVDDAIVVGERVYAHEQQGKDQFTAAVEGTAEVAVPVIFGVLTTMAAFTPLMFTPGNLGQLLSVIGYVVVICLVFSIIESQLILPAHLAHRRMSTRKQDVYAFHGAWRRLQQRVATGIERFAHDIFGPALDRVLKVRYTALALGFSVLPVAVALILSDRIEVQFLPPIEGEAIIARVEMPEGVDVEQTARAARQIEAAALQLKAELDAAYPDRPSLIEHIFTSVGQTLGGRFRTGPQSHSITASARSCNTIPSPRFSTAGNQAGSSAMSARSTSASYSPSTFGITGSSRVKPASARTSRSLCTWTMEAMPSLRVDRRQTDSGRRRAWKSGSTGTSSPKPSGAASSASSSAVLIGRSAAPPPARRAAIAFNTSSSANATKRAATPGNRFTISRLAASVTICSCCHRSSTASSTSVPRSGKERTLSTCGNQAFDAVRISSRLGRLQSSPAWRPSHGRAPLQVPRRRLDISVASCMRRDLPHSQRTICSARSPLVPLSSSLS